MCRPVCNMRVPFLLKPVSKDYLWGGCRLRDEFHYDLTVFPFAEAWLCSTHPDGVSMLAGGEDLRELLKYNPAWLGTHVLELTGGRPELPILIKLIDADQDLSVQVHPDDAYALAHEKDLGKTELWYVLDAAPGSEVVFGFRRNVDAEEVRTASENGTIHTLLNHVPAEKNDVFYIEAGTVHAIGAGCLIAEIQESSNITYRLYDYDRKDRYGQKRALHMEKVLHTADMKASAFPRQPMRVLRYRKGCATELLGRCKYFQVERMLLNTEDHGVPVIFRTDRNSFHALLVTDGAGIISADGFQMDFSRGDCIFVPAESALMEICGKAQLLDVCC